jgi:hypothetical protein
VRCASSLLKQSQGRYLIDTIVRIQSRPVISTISIIILRRLMSSELALLKGKVARLQ